MLHLALTYRAHADLDDIEEFSKRKWGPKTADKYLEDIYAAIARLSENPDLLRHTADVSEHLKFYRVNSHFLVCDITQDRIIILTIKHASMDIPQRIKELEPTLLQEANLMHEHLIKAKRPRPRNKRKKGAL